MKTRKLSIEKRLIHMNMKGKTGTTCAARHSAVLRMTGSEEARINDRSEKVIAVSQAVKK